MDFSWNKPSSYGDTHFKKPPWRAPPRLGNHATSLACWAGRKLCLGCGEKMLMRTQKDQKDQFLLSQNRSNSGYDLDHYSNSNDRYDLKIFKGFLGIEATSDCSEIVSISFMTIIGLLHDNHRWVSRKHGYNDQACASKSCLEAPTVAFERSSTLVWIHLNIHQEVPWYPKSNNLSSFFLLLFPVCIPFLDVDPFMLTQCPTCRATTFCMCHWLLHRARKLKGGCRHVGKDWERVQNALLQHVNLCSHQSYLQCFLWLLL